MPVLKICSTILSVDFSVHGETGIGLTRKYGTAKPEPDGYSGVSIVVQYQSDNGG
jgi:hypothetical protein